MILKWKQFIALVLAVTAICSVSGGETGLCRYDSERCSCRIGDAGQGVCWDAVDGKPGLCKRRSCASGWTCSCGGRTHTCYRSSQQAFSVSDADKALDEATCSKKAVQAASAPEIELGTFKPYISPKGTAANVSVHDSMSARAVHPLRISSTTLIFVYFNFHHYRDGNLFKFFMIAS